MIKESLLNRENVFSLINLLSKDINDLKYFKKLGWSNISIKNQVEKTDNFSLGLFKFDKLIGFILGNFIFVDKFSEYEILLIYVEKKYRNLGHASYLINAVESSSYLHKLNRITLEVSNQNIPAINLYKKNGFYKISKRKNYYNVTNNFKTDAIIFEKKYE